MKRALILLIAVVFCQASAQEWYEKPQPFLRCGSTYYKQDTTKDWLNDLKHEYFVAAFLRLYSEYERDCWNDSTLVHGAMFRDYDSGQDFWARHRPRAGVMEANLLFLEDRWLHRQPTFEGFISWLRKKVKE